MASVGTVGIHDLVESSKQGDEQNNRHNVTQEKDGVLCPACMSGDTEKHEYYYRCNNSSCDNITFIPYKTKEK